MDLVLQAPSLTGGKASFTPMGVEAKSHEKGLLIRPSSAAERFIKRTPRAPPQSPSNQSAGSKLQNKVSCLQDFPVAVNLLPRGSNEEKKRAGTSNLCVGGSEVPTPNLEHDQREVTSGIYFSMARFTYALVLKISVILSIIFCFKGWVTVLEP